MDHGQEPAKFRYDVKEAFTVFYHPAEADRLGRVPVGGETEINNRRVPTTACLLK